MYAYIRIYVCMYVYIYKRKDFTAYCVRRQRGHVRDIGVCVVVWLCVCVCVSVLRVWVCMWVFFVCVIVFRGCASLCGSVFCVRLWGFFHVCVCVCVWVFFVCVCLSVKKQQLPIAYRWIATIASTSIQRYGFINQTLTACTFFNINWGGGVGGGKEKLMKDLHTNPPPLAAFSWDCMQSSAVLTANVVIPVNY